MLVLLIINSVVCFAFYYINSLIMLSEIQSNYYRIERLFSLTYFKIYYKKIFVEIICELFALLFLISSIINLKLNLYFNIIAVLINLFILFYTYKFKNIKFKFTTRGIRIVIINSLIFIFAFLTSYFNFKNTNLTYIIIETILIFNFTGILFAIIIDKPFCFLTNMHYFIKAKRKLMANKNLIIIGITGSYGKTSCKNILKTMLEERYSVVITPKNYNTKNGIIKTINNSIKATTNVFVAEIGADKKNDINKTCRVIKPDISILTAVGNCHLKTFKCKKNIIKTKYSLLLNTKKFTILNGENRICKMLFKKESITNRTSYLVNLNDNDIKLSNLKVDFSGCSFDVENLFNTKIKIKTKLLGKHNIVNILLCVYVCKILGLSKEEILRGINKIEPVKNRLELQNISNNLTIINDAYNANIVGAINALNVLNSFGCYKVCVTPGFVELGKVQYEENYKFASKICCVCDFVIVVKKENSLAFKNAFKNCKFENYCFVSSFKDALNVVNKINIKKVVLIENDLPNTYV